MGTLADYFEKNRYLAKYQIGDRVIGKYKGIPFVGSVGNDRLVSEETGPEITIHLDLPLKIKDKCCTILIVKHKDIKPLK